MRAIDRRTTWGKIAASLAIGVLVALSFGGIADKTAQDYTETGFRRALITYATARAINGIISVAQGTEVAIQPGGVGAVLTPGEILDPINDLVEQFSQVMLFSAAVLGTQKLLIEISGWLWFSALLVSVLVFWLATLWRADRFAAGTQRTALAVAGIMLLIRFLVPVAAIANEAVFDLFLAPRYEAANRQLEDATRDLGSEQKSVARAEGQTGADNSLLEALGGFYESARNRADVSAQIEELKAAANQTAEDIIDLIALFMVQTLLLPLLFAWLGYAGAKRLVRFALEAPRRNESDSARRGPPAGS
jgi:hypothetical protein